MKGPDVARDAERAADLRRMKATALSLLIVAAAVFVTMRILGDEGWRGYVEATAEAAMVGAVADWFAVTALFRHPLWLPIPHTAIIPRRKAALGASLGDFVQENFLDRDTVSTRVRRAEPARWIADGLANPEVAQRVAGHAVQMMVVAADAVDETVVDEVLRPAVDAGLRRADTARVLARGLDAALASGQHQQALDSVLRGLDQLVLDNGPLFRARLGEESPKWVPEFVDDRVYDRLVLGVRRFIADVLGTPDHELRRQLTERMTLLAERLRTDPALQQRVDDVRDELLDRPELRGWIEEFWTQVRVDLRAAAESPTSGLHERTGRLVERIGRRLVDDAEMRGKLDDLIVRLAGTATERARPEIAEIISTTVDRWDADDTSRRIELQIGRDLQFIRINGTVVGGLVGLLIHTVGELI
ncbi:MAG: DUF445 family protein [Actinomycetota bacterium]